MKFCIFTDGACEGNPGRGGWGAIILDSNNQVVEIAGSNPKTTNNQMEMTAALMALKAIEMDSEAIIDLFTDSSYLIDGITKWVFGWMKRGWRKSDGEEVKNKEIWESILNEVNRLKSNGIKVNWNYVPGHQGVPGNERADELAASYARNQILSLYQGSASGYPITLEAPRPSETINKKSKKSSKKAYSYLSLLSGALQRHMSWGECENRVSGARNAKYKKCLSPEDEKKVAAEWGVLDLYEKL